jgi:hypothetical protein
MAVGYRRCVCIACLRASFVYDGSDSGDANSLNAKFREVFARKKRLTSDKSYRKFTEKSPDTRFELWCSVGALLWLLRWIRPAEGSSQLTIALLQQAWRSATVIDLVTQPAIRMHRKK